MQVERFSLFIISTYLVVVKCRWVNDTLPLHPLAPPLGELPKAERVSYYIRKILSPETEDFLSVVLVKSQGQIVDRVAGFQNLAVHRDGNGFSVVRTQQGVHHTAHNHIFSRSAIAAD